MNRIFLSALAVSAGGMIMTMAEMLLPKSKIRGAAKAAIGVLFLELWAEQIACIFR